MKRATPAAACRCRNKPKYVPIEEIQRELMKQLDALKRSKQRAAIAAGLPWPPPADWQWVDDEAETPADTADVPDPHDATIALLGQWNAKKGGA